MEKSQILKLLKTQGQKITITRLNQVITACNLDPNATDYSDEQVAWILNGVAQKPDTHRKTKEQAKHSAEQTRSALAMGQQMNLNALTNALDRAEQRREEAIERLSDRIAYIQDDRIFLAELLSRTQQKLTPTPEAAQQEAMATEIDALSEAFDSIFEWEYPALVLNSVAGCLPM
ncbi:MAG: hypothetical protein SFW36_17985 [Leptolyngbyaceae cyanobacterium bins.59]|nr:hypothetical protein [Leptolyngbyaceae cyanobacterium bins.59]